MVESIKNTISRMEPRKANNNHSAPQIVNKSAATTSAIDSVELKSGQGTLQYHLGLRANPLKIS